MVLAKNDNGKVWFVRQVAEGDSSLDAETIARFSEQLGVGFTCGCYFCIAVQFANQNILLENIAKLTELEDICSRLDRILKNNVYCYTGPQMRVVLVVSGNQEERFQIADLIYGNIARRIGNTIRMGVGRSVSDLEKLSYSRAEAYEAINYAENDITISYIEDIYATRSSTTRKLDREKRKVVELFRAGDWIKMQECVETLVENVRMESPVREGMAYPTSIRRTMVELLAEIMHTCADAGIDVEAVLDRQDPYNYIYGLVDTYKIIAKFLEVARLLFNELSEQNFRAENNLLSKARKFIEANIGNTELCLSLVSDELKITPTYFSAFFIREVGIGFNEYITKQRVERSKKLLSETNMRINDIGEDCGFRSGSYFIVVFKKHTGMSPGEFRKAKI